MRLTELPPLGRIARARTRLPSKAAELTEIDDFGPNPGHLRMYVHVPAGLQKSAPLVVILHGCGQTAAGYALGSGWLEAANRLGFALLAPEQRSANNVGGCFNWFRPGDTAREEGEAASIRQMIAHLSADQDLDSGRIFITGLSAGGAMTAAMLAAYPEIFAGAAIIAGLPYGAASNVSEALNAMRRAPQHAQEVWAEKVRDASGHPGPWPALSIWHGDADTTVHIGNADALVSQWIELQGLGPQPSQVEETPLYNRRSWQNADRKTILEFYSVPGLAHGVPIHAGRGKDSSGQPGPFFIEAGLSSTLKIADFWDLKRPAPHVATENTVLTPALPKRIIPDIAPSNAALLKTARKVGGVRGVILKALKAAGLAGKP